jgi:hypothetical protein
MGKINKLGLFYKHLEVLSREVVGYHKKPKCKASAQDNQMWLVPEDI